MWFISGPVLMTTAILTLENHADAWKAESRNTIPHLLVQFSTLHSPKAYISQFNIIDQDRKQISSEAREAIHIRRNNPALN